MAPPPATRVPRRSTHLRAALVAGMGLLALVAVGWALVTPDGDEPLVEAAAAPLAVIESASSEPSTATLVETPPSAPADNPFETGTGPDRTDPTDTTADPVAATLAAAAHATAAPAASANPFSAMQAPPRGTASLRAAPAPAAAAPRPAAMAKSPAAPAARPTPAQPAKEAGLLQTLMENIQQPSVPERDTRGMDRLARQLDRAPMPEAAPAGAATVPSAATPAPKPSTAPAAVSAGRDVAPIATPTHAAPATAKTQEKQTLRDALNRCPAFGSPQGQRCRRQMCQRAGVEPRLCTRH